MEEGEFFYEKLISYAKVNEQFSVIFKLIEAKKNLSISEKNSTLLGYISREIFVVPYYLKSVLDHFPQHVPKLLNMALSFSNVAPFTQNRHLLNCLLLSHIVRIRSDMSGYALKYFDKYASPFHTEVQPQQKHRKVSLVENVSIKDLDIVESTYFLLKSNPDFYRGKWKWTEFIKHFVGHRDAEVYWVSCQTIAIVFGFNELKLLNLILKRIPEDVHVQLAYKFDLNKGLARQNVDIPTLDQHPLLPSSKLDQKDLICVSGIYLPCVSTLRSHLLIEVPSTYNNLRKIAIGLFSNKALCLQGPVGSGKTSLVDHLAMKTGHKLGETFIKLQLGDQTDSKTILGTYKCTNIPGEFLWQPGILTQAVTEGNWLLLEDIDQANMDIASVLTNLLESNALTVPGYRDMVPVTSGFQLFVTQRMVTTHTGHHKKHSSSMSLLEKHLLQIAIDPLTNEELKQILNTIYPQFETIVDRLVKVFNLFSNKTEESLSQVFLKGRQMSTRDFFKWCARASQNFDVKSQACALKVLQDAIDVFCCSLAKNEDALELAKQISTYLGIINQKAEYFFKNYKPVIQLTAENLVAERVVLEREHTLFEKPVKFCFTRPASVLLERIMCCVQLQEPVLLVGETGTGKTSSVQYLAHALGRKMVVINMNQQSDSTDLLGGFKPVDQKLVISPVKKQFEELFCEYFKIEPNRKYLSNIAFCFNNQRYSDLVKLMLKSTDAALQRLSKEISEKESRKALEKSDQDTKKEKTEYFLNQWKEIKEKLTVLDSQLKNKNALAFDFVEGSLVRAIQNGSWVLLDEINLANAETLDCLSGLLEDTKSSLCLVERGDKKPIERHPGFTLFACMNPSTDVGKKDLPSGLRNRFTEFFVVELTSRSDLISLVQSYLGTMSLKDKDVSNIVDFYLAIRNEVLNSLSDGLGHKPHFSLRSLCRALMITARNPCGTFRRSLFEAFSMSFLTQLDCHSYMIVEKLIYKYLIGDKTSNKAILKQPIPKPEERDEDFLQFEGYWVKKGNQEPCAPNNYILTESVKKNLKDLVRVVSIGKLPVLLQGDTSVGKTSLITFLAQSSGNKCVRINNHEHTDLQEYIGSYVADQNGKLVFREGVLVEAMRMGHWIILDELNLAPTDVLEALNRVLDDNRELFIPETQETVKANANFMLFATQNPPGAYGGRKMLSRAFRNRFVELHFNEIPPAELECILQKRCKMAQSYARKMINVMTELQTRRRGSAAFAGKQGFITLRDLFRWGERYRLANVTDRLYDWDQHMTDEGYLILAGKVRKDQEKNEIVDVLQKHWKREVVLDNLFTLHEKTSPVTRHFLEKIQNNSARYPNIVWTFNMRKLAVLIHKALEFKEPVLLVGETGGGKTTVCQLIADMNGQELATVNCHMHTESSDFIGGLRPIRDHSENNKSLFEWVDGPLLTAMRQGSVFLSDEISLADDSVLERLNSLLEPERSLLLAEKGIDLNNLKNSELLVAHENFVFIGTMNPGGDFGKKELSPALRNRFTEIWCDSVTDRNDMIAIIEKNLECNEGKSVGVKMMDFMEWFMDTQIGKRYTVSIRDILTWVKFINSCKNLHVSEAYLHGAHLVFLDSLGSGATSAESSTVLTTFKSQCEQVIASQFIEKKPLLSKTDQKIIQTPSYFGIDPFLIPIGTENKVQINFSLQAPTTVLNTLIVLRGLQLNKPILLEGSPGVGKTSLITALAKFSHHKIFRVNLSDQTDISDLFGADLPVEGGAGQFAWRDGPLLQALKKGSWILLDELNLASQSVLEGLNACLDHRGEIFIPELGKTFHVKKGTRFFACQNPMKQGGSRRGLPKSFLNRFIQVYVNSLNPSDMRVILSSEFPKLPQDLITKMVDFCFKLNEELSKKTFGYKGAPWECNLRDLTRWCEVILYQFEASSCLDKALNLNSTMELIFADRMRDSKDRQCIKDIFECEVDQKMPVNKIVAYINNQEVLFGDVTLKRTQNNVNDNILKKDKGSMILRRQLGVLRTLTYCVNLNWMTILVGSSGSGKSSVVKTLAKLAGKSFRTFPVTSAMDTTDILGGFEQTDYSRHILEIAKMAERQTFLFIQKYLVEEKSVKAVHLLEFWEEYLSLSDVKTNSSKEEIDLFLRKITKLEALQKELYLKCTNPDEGTQILNSIDQCGKIYTAVMRDQSISAGGRFEWVNSILIKCLQEGSWLLIDNVNLCSPAVLDRLNALLEPNGILTVCERGVDENGQVFEIKPHKDFRLFLTMDPKNGEISRAMRNRGLEIYLENFSQLDETNDFDIKSLIDLEGLSDPTHMNRLLKVHDFISSLILSEKPHATEILSCANLIAQQLQHGISVDEAFTSAFIEIYFKRRNLSEFNSNNVLDVIKDGIKRCLDNENHEIDNYFNKNVTINTENLVRWSSLEKVKQQAAFLESIAKELTDDKIVLPKNDNGLLSVNRDLLIWTDLEKVKSLLKTFEDNHFYYNANLIGNIFSVSSQEDLAIKILLAKNLEKSTEWNNFVDRITKICSLFNRVNKNLPIDYQWIENSPRNKSDAILCGVINIALQIEIQKLNDKLKIKTGGKNTLYNYVLLRQKNSVPDIFNNAILNNYLQLYDEMYIHLRKMTLKLQELSSDQVVNFIFCLHWLQALHSFLTSVELPQGGFGNLLVNQNKINALVLHYKWFYKYTVQNNAVTQQPLSDKLKIVLKLTNESMDHQFSVMYRVNKSYKKFDNVPEQFKTKEQVDASEVVDRFDINDKSSYALATLRNSAAVRNNLIELKSELYDNYYEMSDKLSFVKSVQDSEVVFSDAENQVLPVLDFFAQAFVLTSLKNIEYDIGSMDIQPVLSNLLVPVDLSGLIFRSKAINDKKILHELRKLYFTCSMNSASTKPDFYLKPSQENSKNLLVSGLYPVISYSLCNLLIIGENSETATLQSFKDAVHQQKILTTTLWHNLGLIGNEKYDFLYLQYFLVKQLVSNFLDTLEKSLNIKIYCRVSGTVNVKDLKNCLPKSVINKITAIVETLNLLPVEDDLQKSEFDSTLTKISDLHLVLGYIQVAINSYLPQVDPLAKKAIKNVHITSILSMFKQMQKSFVTQNLLFSNDESTLHPYHAAIGRMVKHLEDKLEKYTKYVTGGPKSVVYELVVQQVHSAFETVVQETILQDANDINKLLETLKSGTQKRETLLEKIASYIRRMKAIIPSFERIISDWKSYKYSYPDIIEPLLSNISQILYGLKLKLFILKHCSMKYYYLEHHQKDLETELENLVSFPSVCEKLTSLDHHVVSYTNVDNVRVLASASTGFVTPHLVQKETVRLLKCGIQETFNQCITDAKLRGSLNKDLVDKFKELVAIFIDLYNQQQDKQEQMQKEMEALYKTRTKCEEKSEEDQIKDDFNELFAIEDTTDFDDIQRDPTKDTPADKNAPIIENSDFIIITKEDLKIVSSLHTVLFTTFTKSEWLRPQWDTNVAPNYVDPLVEKFHLVKNILNKHVDNLPYTTDAPLLSGLTVLLSAVSQLNGDVEDNAILPNSTSWTPKNGDFYKNSNITEVKNCYYVLENLRTTISKFLEEWPGQPTLIMINTVIDRIQNFSIASPISRFLTGFEILLNKCYEWEQVAHSGISISDFCTELVNQIISWRKLELSKWKELLNTTFERLNEPLKKWWVYLYNIMQQYTLEMKYSETELADTLKNFITTSNMAEFQGRVDLLFEFHCHAVTMPKSRERESFLNVLWNIYNYFKHFVATVANKLKELRGPVEKKVKDYLKIVKWKDVNYWTVKQTIQNTQKVLHKFVREYKELLTQPVCTYLVNTTSDTSEETIGIWDRPQRSSPKSYHYALEADSYVIKTTSKERKILQSRKICKETILATTYPSLLLTLDTFVTEIIENSKRLRDLEIDTTLPVEKQKSQAKTIQQQKQRGLSDLFKYLIKLGLSYKTGLIKSDKKATNDNLNLKPIDLKSSFMFMGNSSADEKILIIWENCETYYFRCLVRYDILQNVLKNPATDLGLRNIERCKGFGAHLLTLVQRQKKSLITSSRYYYYLRTFKKQILEACESNHYVTCDTYHQLNKVLTNILVTMEQYTIVLNSCPQSVPEGEWYQTSPLDSQSDKFRCQNTQSWKDAMKFVNNTVTNVTKLSVNLQKCCTIVSMSEENDMFMEYYPFMKTEQFKTEIDNLFDSLVNLKETLEPTKMSSAVKILINLLNDVSLLCLKDTKANNDVTTENFQVLLDEFKHDVLIVFQTFYNKEKHENLTTEDNQSELQDEHLKTLIVNSISSDVGTLNLNKLITLSKRILSALLSAPRDIRDKLKQSVTSVLPLLEQILLLSLYFITQQVSAYRISCKLMSTLLNIFIELVSKGFCIPSELSGEKDSDGMSKPSNGMGLGDGQGEKDVSDRIESEDQLDDARPAGEEKNQDEDPDCKENEKGIEMSDDFDSKLQDKTPKNDDDSSDESDTASDVEEQMGETEKGAEELDKEIWGSDQEEEGEDEGNDETENSNKGETKEKGQMGAKDDKTEQNSDETEPSDQQEDSSKNEINEMNEPEFDDEQVDNMHGKQPELPEPEALDLPDDLQLDEGEENDAEENNEENDLNFDADKERDLEKELPKDNDHKDEEKQDDAEKDFDSDDEDITRKEHADIEEKSEETEESDINKDLDQDKGKDEEEKSAADAENGQQDEENDDDIEITEDETGLDQNPSNQENIEAMEVDKSEAVDKTQSVPAENTKQNSERQTEETNQQDDGLGESQMEENTAGHSSANQNPEMQSSSKTMNDSQPENQKPGRSDPKRTLGNVNEPANKKRKTVESEEKEQKSEQEKKDSEDVEMYQHIEDAEDQETAQVFDSATKDQVEEQQGLWDDKPNEEESEEEKEANNLEEVNKEKEKIEKSEKDANSGKKSEKTKEKSSKSKDNFESELTGELQDTDIEGEITKTEIVPRGGDTFHATQYDISKTILPKLTTEEITNIRSEVEHQLATWNSVPSGAEAESAWQKISSVTLSLAQDLSEQLRLVLEPTQASSLKGDFRTGRRINMRKIIPYIASQFRKDKIWLRRTKPSKRDYQIVLAIDDSSSMDDSHSKELAFESVALISKALSLLESGQLAVLSFGESTKVHHSLTEQFTNSSGVNLLQTLKFNQQKTCIGKLVNFTTELFEQTPTHSSAQNAKLLLVVSDGRGIFSEGKSYVDQTIRRARLANIFMVFVIIDNPSNKDSILDIRLPVFEGGKLVQMKNYMDDFPFSFYVILRDINSLPSVLSDALRQWFEIVSNVDVLLT